MINRLFQKIFTRISTISLGFLAVFYIVAYAAIESLIQNYIQLYIFTVFLALSGIYFSWFRGGKLTMIYVAFFNMFIVFVFSKLLWHQNIIVSTGVFKSKSFIIMYCLTIIFIVIVALKKSPADAKQEEQSALIEEEKQQRQNLEFMVASKKLKYDLLAQANLVKDELQLLEGAWRSNIHDIKNDIPDVEERKLYEQIVLPFQNNIIEHLKNLEKKLTFDTVPIVVSDLLAFFEAKLLTHNQKGPKLDMSDFGWADNETKVNVDINKMWDMVHNIYRNCRAALDFKRISHLNDKQNINFIPNILFEFRIDKNHANLIIIDNGGGILHESAQKLFKEPVLSVKRRNKSQGQGTLFVKFFAERMNIHIKAQNSFLNGEPGLKVTMSIPLLL